MRMLHEKGVLRKCSFSSMCDFSGGGGGGYPTGGGGRYPTSGGGGTSGTWGVPSTGPTVGGGGGSYAQRRVAFIAQRRRALRQRSQRRRRFRSCSFFITAHYSCRLAKTTTIAREIDMINSYSLHQLIRARSRYMWRSYYCRGVIAVNSLFVVAVYW